MRGSLGSVWREGRTVLQVTSQLYMEIIVFTPAESVHLMHPRCEAW